MKSLITVKNNLDKLKFSSSIRFITINTGNRTDILPIFAYFAAIVIISFK